MTHSSITDWVEAWIRRTFPNDYKNLLWNYDDNNARRTIEIPHVHIYICRVELNMISDGRVKLKDVMSYGVKEAKPLASIENKRLSGSRDN